jgi:hypothetical protein
VNEREGALERQFIGYRKVVKKQRVTKKQAMELDAAREAATAASASPAAASASPAAASASPAAASASPAAASASPAAATATPLSGGTQGADIDEDDFPDVDLSDSSDSEEDEEEDEEEGEGELEGDAADTAESVGKLGVAALKTRLKKLGLKVSGKTFNSLDRHLMTDSPSARFEGGVGAAYFRPTGVGSPPRDTGWRGRGQRHRNLGARSDAEDSEVGSRPPRRNYEVLATSGW